MEKYTVKATLEITAEGTGASPEEVLEKAIAHKKYTITGYTIGKQAIDRYVTLSEYAKMHNLPNTLYLRKQCKNGIIPGAILVGRNWVIPADTPHKDYRYKTGAYVGMYEKRGKKQYEKKKAAREAAKAEQEATQAPE